jgi:6-pyruvoyltetrahydropterin/6-carboxytetrahydropterin synthase
MAKLTITKQFREIPFAHRQHKHQGRCFFGHGHGWTFDVTFSCTEKDENGFVIDFGKLKFISAWIDEHLDHAFIVAQDDPKLHDVFAVLAKGGLIRLCVVPDSSAEGLAEYLLNIFHSLVQANTKGRVSVTKVTVWEDSKNSATYEV